MDVSSLTLHFHGKNEIGLVMTLIESQSIVVLITSSPRFQRLYSNQSRAPVRTSGMWRAFFYEFSLKMKQKDDYFA